MKRERAKVRLSFKNYQRLKLIKREKSLTQKLDEILNLYFSNGGGKKELKNLENDVKILKTIL